MLSKLKELHDTLADFVHQDRYRVLVIRLTQDELALVLKLIETLDQQEHAHVFGISADSVAEDQAAYVATVLAALEAQIRPLNELRVAAGDEAWPPFPPAFSDTRLAPARRLCAGVLYAAGLVSGGEEHHFVYALMPQSIGNAPAYVAAVSELVASLAEPKELAPRRLRLILRDDGERPLLIERLRREKNPNALVYEPDVTPPALMDAMARDAVDPGTPEPHRMQMLTQLGCLDLAYDRLEEATAKFGAAYDYYRRQNLPVMQAFVLQCVGDVLRRSRNLPLARERYGQGFALALETQAILLMMSLAYAVGDTSLELQQYQDAVAHLAIARDIAAKTRNSWVEADALEKLGQAELALNKPAAAIASWRDAAAICRSLPYRERLGSVLDRLVKTLAMNGKTADRLECEAELARLRAGAAAGGEKSAGAAGPGGSSSPGYLPIGQVQR